jgi:AraC-like DNA-binding protein
MNFDFLNMFKPELISASILNAKNLPIDKEHFGLRRVDTYELDFIIWGNGYILTDGEKSPVSRGKLFLRKPGMYVDGYLPYHCYYLRLKLFDDDRYNLFPKEFPTEIVFNNPMVVEDLFSKIYIEYVLKRPVGMFLIKTYLMQIFALVFENLAELSSSSEYRSSSDCRNISEIAGYIKDNVHMNFTLDQLSQMSGYSRFAFCRYFKSITGSTPIEFINNCKIQHARRLLLETNKSMKEICFECGFNNESYFFILFNKLTGSSPSKYRKQNRMW